MLNTDDAIDYVVPKKQALHETIVAIAKRMTESREQKQDQNNKETPDKQGSL